MVPTHKLVPLVAMELPLTLAHLVHTKMEVTALAPVLQTHKLVPHVPETWPMQPPILARLLLLLLYLHARLDISKLV